MEINETQNKEVRKLCLKCDDQTYHKVMISLNTTEEVNPDDETIFFVDYEIVQCQGCKAISFRKALRDINDVFNDGKGGFINDIDITNPGRVEQQRQQLKDSGQLPSTILGIYDETHAAFCNKLHVLTVWESER